MTVVLTVARREVLEAVRQRWLLVTLCTVLGVIVAASLGLLVYTDGLAADPHQSRRLTWVMDVLGFPLENPGPTLASTVVVMLQALIFNQLMSMTAVMAGHAGIHDRQTGTLPFLLLAPVRRFPLLLGKVIGALGVPLLIYVAIGGLASVEASRHLSAAGTAQYLPPSPGWFAAFLVGAPLWSIFTGTFCVLVSAVARDVRTAQQAAWAVVFFATFVLSPLLVGLMPYALAQVILAVLGLGLSLVALAVGSWVIGRDLTR